MKAAVAAEHDAARSWIRPYYASFNGLRGLAVFVVFLNHYAALLWWPDVLQAAWVGVDLFFVLSGFLITGILFDSVESPHYFKNFYIRRALRIFPIFYGLFALFLIFTPLLHLKFELSALSYLLYVGNIVAPIMRLHDINPTIILIPTGAGLVQFTNLGHLWSLCVEEQFYLLWPALVWLVRGRQRLMNVCVLLVGLTIAVRCALFIWYPPERGLMMYWATYCRCDTLLVGAWIALWLRGEKLTRRRLRQVGCWVGGSAAAVLLVGCAITHPVRVLLSNSFVETVGYTFIALTCAGLLILSLDESLWVSKALQWKPLASLGIISYGFYLLHALPKPWAERLAERHPQSRFAIAGAIFVVVWIAATLSYRYYESRFLRMKHGRAPEWQHARKYVAQPPG